MEEQKHYISRVKLPNDDNIYYLKDLELRQLIAELFTVENGEYILNCGTAEPYMETSVSEPH